MAPRAGFEPRKLVACVADLFDESEGIAETFELWRSRLLCLTPADPICDESADGIRAVGARSHLLGELLVAATVMTVGEQASGKPRARGGWRSGGGGRHGAD